MSLLLSLDMRHEEDLLKEVSKERAKDKIVILVIHNLRTAIKYCSRLILLSNGNIVKMEVLKKLSQKKT